jgi:hypothetical protein
MPNAGYDLSAINEDLCCDIKEGFFWIDRGQKDKEWELSLHPPIAPS